jgi:hypothetical protein
MSVVPNTLQGLASPSTPSTSSGLSGILNDILNYSPPSIVQTLEQASRETISPGPVTSAWATGAISWGLGAAQGGAASAAGYRMVNMVTRAAGGAVSTAVGDSALLAGALSVPKSWATAAPASLVAAAVPAATAQGIFSGMPLFRGAPLMTMSGCGATNITTRNT